MRAKLIENIDFERGLEPSEAMGIGNKIVQWADRNGYTPEEAIRDRDHLRNISGEPDYLSFKEFKEYIQDYINGAEIYDIDLNSSYGEMLLWAKSDPENAYELMKIKEKL